MTKTKKKVVEDTRPLSERFSDWLQKTKPEDMSDTSYMKVLGEKSNVSRETLRTILMGRRISNYSKAKTLEALTGIPAQVFVEGK